MQNWIKAKDINHPMGWYWLRLGDHDSMPQVVYISLHQNGDSAPDFRVLHVGESSRSAPRLSKYTEQEWEFLPIQEPAAFDILSRSAEAQSTLVRYDDANCDGYCLLDDIASELGISINTEPIELQDQD